MKSSTTAEAVILKAQEEAARMTKEGMKAQRILKTVNTNLGRYKKYFTHGLGHQIGLDVHEGRGIRKKEKDLATTILLPSPIWGSEYKNSYG